MEKIKTKARLIGDPAFALYFYVPKGVLLSIVPWDLTAFRPDLRDYIKFNVDYPIYVFPEKINLPSGKEVIIPREVDVVLPNKRIRKFVNIR